jgi:hypothetical protein
MAVLFSRPLFSDRPRGSHLRWLVDSAWKAVKGRKAQFAIDRVLQPAWRGELGLTKGSKVCKGDLKVREIFRLLDGLGVVRTDDQVSFHWAIVAALLPKIYGSEWPAEAERVLREWGLKKINPRRT